MSVTDEKPTADQAQTLPEAERGQEHNAAAHIIGEPGSTDTTPPAPGQHLSTEPQAPAAAAGAQDGEDQPTGRVVARYDGPSGRFLAGHTEWTIGQEQELDAADLAALQAQFEPHGHSWTVTKKKATRTAAKKSPAESKPAAPAKARSRSRR